jgi:uncharacterized FAD-dependent dehydrogenase
MSRIFHDLKLDIDEELEEHLSWLTPDYTSYDILKKSVDARKGRPLKWVYSVKVYEKGERPEKESFELEALPFYRGEPVLIVGAGPAGLFAALRLLERGIPCRLLEQGSRAEKRLGHINRFWRYGEFHPRNNVGFGEGGAGLYSDGKLITRIKSPYIAYVMDRLIRFGAPEEIRYLSNPHVGSDRIRRLIPVMRRRLEELGGELLYDTKMTDLIVEGREVRGVRLEDGRELRSSQVILACGHSAEDLFHRLREQGVFMEGKSFAMGLRVEHPQADLNKIQYREHHENPKLGAANYRLAHHDKKEDVGVYSFCMCPGGYVLSSATEEKRMVVNGMSNYRRNSPFANSAIVVSIDFEKTFGGEDLFAGLRMRQSLEERAFHMVQERGGGHKVPAQALTDFLKAEVKATELATSCPSGVIAAPLHELFPERMNLKLGEGFRAFERKMPGFISKSAVLHGIESRTSCPLRITRDKENLQSLSHAGLYPTGEGAGYAGGITSAACDGIRVAEEIYKMVRSQR